MTDKHDLSTYSKLAEAARFYLDESFRNVDNALITELSGILFAKKIQEIDPTEKDKEIAGNTQMPENHIHVMQNEHGEVMTDETIGKLADAWSLAQFEALRQPHTFSKNHVINAIELLGHINYLAFFVETLTNRHLLFLQQTGVLDNFTYNNLSLAKILNRLIFVCKEELETNKIQLNEIANLFSLRNKTVHYTPDNALAFKTDIASLIRIWNQTIKLLKLFERKEKFVDNIFSDDLNHCVADFNQRWLTPAKVEPKK